LRPVQANSSQDPISKRTRAKWTGGVAQAAEYWLCKCNDRRSNPNTPKIIIIKRKQQMLVRTWENEKLYALLVGM
jgi:hypothetical protein